MKYIILFTLILTCAPVYAQKTSEKQSKKAETCEQQSDYKTAIKMADSALAAKDFSQALNHYREAVRLCPKSNYPKEKIAETELLLMKQKEAEEELQYNKVIAAADNAFAEKNYAKAKEYYQRAVTFKSKDPYPIQKLKEIEAILSAQEK